MRLDQGGHLTHGSPVNFSGRFYDFVAYGVDDTDETLDYDAIRELAKREHPKLIIAGATAYSRIIDFEAFRSIADDVGALLMVDAAHIAGLIAGGAHPSPLPLADIVTFTTHKTLRGPRAGAILCRAEYATAIDKAVFPGLQGGPLMHVIAAKAVAFHEAQQPDFRTYAAEIVVNARALADALAAEGLRIVSGGTDNHLFLVDLRPFGVTGKIAQEALDRAGADVQQERDTERPGEAVRDEWTAVGDRSRHHGGHGPGADGRDRDDDRRGAARARRCRDGRRRARPGRPPLRQVHAVSRMTMPRPTVIG